MYSDHTHTPSFLWPFTPHQLPSSKYIAFPFSYLFALFLFCKPHWLGPSKCSCLVCKAILGAIVAHQWLHLEAMIPFALAKKKKKKTCHYLPGEHHLLVNLPLSMTECRWFWRHYHPYPCTHSCFEFKSTLAMSCPEERPSQLYSAPSGSLILPNPSCVILPKLVREWYRYFLYDSSFKCQLILAPCPTWIPDLISIFTTNYLIKPNSWW